MKIYLISLETNQKRRDDSLEELAKQSFLVEDELELVDAVVGDWLSFEMCQKWPASVPRGGIGCFLSHVRVMRRMLTFQVGEAIVLEDDFQFLREFDLLKWEKDRPDDAGYIAIHNNYLHWANEKSLGKSIHGFIPMERIPLTTTGYWCNYEFAEKVVALHEKHHDHIDHFYQKMLYNERVPSYKMKYPLVTQRNTDSTIQYEKAY